VGEECTDLRDIREKVSPFVLLNLFQDVDIHTVMDIKEFLFITNSNVFLFQFYISSVGLFLHFIFIVNC